MDNTDIDKATDEMLSQIDQLKSDGNRFGLESMHQIQVLANLMMRQEQKRLSKKLGTAHPRVRQMQVGLKNNNDFIADMQQQLKKLEIKIPDIKENSTLLHGRVRDQAGKNVVATTIKFTDNRGKELPIDTAVTNSAGYFSLELNEEQVTQLQDKSIKMTVLRDNGAVIFTHSQDFKLNVGEHKLITAVVERSKIYEPRKKPKKPKATTPKVTQKAPTTKAKPGEKISKKKTTSSRNKTDT